MGPITAKQEKQKGDSRNRRRAHTTRKQFGGGYHPIEEIENIPNEMQMEKKPTEDQINDSESEEKVKLSAEIIYQLSI